MCYTAMNDLGGILITAGFSPAQCAVYRAIAACANQDGSCWPSAQTIALTTGFGRSTVRRAISELCERDGGAWLKKAARFKTIQNGYGSTQTGNMYVMPKALVLHPWGMGAKGEKIEIGAPVLLDGSPLPDACVALISTSTPVPAESKGGAQSEHPGAQSEQGGCSERVPGVPAESTLINIKENIKESITPCSPPRTSKPKARSFRCPTDWRPADDDIAWAKSEFPGISDSALEDVTGEFVEYWASKKTTRPGWSRTWRMRIRQCGPSLSRKFANDKPREKHNWVQPDGSVERR